MKIIFAFLLYFSINILDETDANNKEILDDPSKQKLSYQEIEKLKKQGLEGQVKKFILHELMIIFVRYLSYYNNIYLIGYY